MLKQPITFHTLDNKVVTRDYYFHMHLLDVMKLELKTGGLEKHMQKLIDTEDAATAYDLFEEIVLDAYGIREDDEHFRKTPESEVRDKFRSSQALPELIIRMLKDTDFANAFIQELLPAHLIQEAKDELAKDAEQSEESKQVLGTSISEVPTAPPVLEEGPSKEFKDFSKEELLSMSDEAFIKLVGTNPMKFPEGALEIAMQRRNQA